MVATFDSRLAGLGHNEYPRHSLGSCGDGDRQKLVVGSFHGLGGRALGRHHPLACRAVVSFDAIFNWARNDSSRLNSALVRLQAVTLQIDFEEKKEGISMSTHPRPLVLVGVDGSPQSIAAAQWAAEEAVRRRQSVQLLYSASLPVIGYPALGYPADFIEFTDREGRRMLDRVAQQLTALHPDLEVGTVLTRTDPRRALVDASDGAALTVVGSRGGGRMQEVLLGSVALHVTARGHSPVAVVPYDRDDRQGPVLVGVDGRADTAAAVGFAFDEAAVRGADLIAVMAFDNKAGQGFARRSITFEVCEAQEEHAVISEQLAGWSEKYPDVQVHEYVFRGQAAECLIGYAGHAPLAQQPQLIVVGSRGRGGLTGFVLGSTSHAVIAHAACPVIVVRPPVN